jgi:hypothetical protein
MYLLPHFHAKNNYDPKNPSFRNYVETDELVTLDGGKKEKKKDIPTHPKGHPRAGAPVDLSGMSAIAAGIGKTTKDMNDLIGGDKDKKPKGDKNNVILLCPNGALCASASQHHSS